MTSTLASLPTPQKVAPKKGGLSFLRKFAGPDAALGGDALLDEKTAAKQLGMSAFTLARLRKLGQIAHVKIGGKVRYPASAIPAYIASKTVQPCTKTNDLKSKVSGSPAIPTAPSGKQLGMTETPGKLSAHHLAQKIFKKPKSA